MTLTQENKNRFFLCLSQNQEPIDVSDLGFSSEHIKNKPDLIYFGRVLDHIKTHIKTSGLIFYITWDVKKLPSYGNHVVPILLGDEWCRIPDYFSKVRATFKAYGTKPEFGFFVFHGSPQIILLNLLQLIRITVLRLPGILKNFVYSIGRPLPPIFDIPLGYFQQLDLPVKAINERDIDIFFAGSIAHKKESLLSLSRWLGGPKTISRRIMIEKVKEIQQRHPELNIKLLETSSFSHSVEAGSKLYSENMMNSKIALIPRGASLETLRFFESVRYGCIPIAEHLPSRWFYNNSPTPRVSNWNQLERIVTSILSNQDCLMTAHQDSLSWWRDNCSENTVGQYIVDRIDGRSESCVLGED